MKMGVSVTSLLARPRHYGKPAPGAFSAAAGSVARACAVQFSAQPGADGLREVRYQAFGGPELIAACEFVAGQAASQGADAIGGATDWLLALALPREALATLLVVEDAWRGLVTASMSNDKGD